jgi:predicted acyl esterase
MPDTDTRGGAWRVTPSAYLETRPAEFSIPKPRSVYITMPDGCRLAADVFVPDGGTSVKRPTIVILTPYCRRFALAPGATNVEACPNTSSYRDMFVPRG